MQFRPKSFWTPRYIRDRLSLAYDQQRHPDAPWWQVDARRHLADMLRRTDACLEWGSGRSTAWLGARTGSVHSVEHDPQWFELVRGQLRDRGLDADAVRLLSTEPLDRGEESPYVGAVRQFDDGEIDVCVVDGEHRGKCAVAATSKLADGGLLIVDDAHWFFDHPTSSPHSRFRKGHADGDWNSFAELVADWRCVWTTDGVTDTAIWVKP